MLLLEPDPQSQSPLTCRRADAFFFFKSVTEVRLRGHMVTLTVQFACLAQGMPLARRNECQMEPQS